MAAGPRCEGAGIRPLEDLAARHLLVDKLLPSCPVFRPDTDYCRWTSCIRSNGRYTFRSRSIGAPPLSRWAEWSERMRYLFGPLALCFGMRLCAIVFQDRGDQRRCAPRQPPWPWNRPREPSATAAATSFFGRANASVCFRISVSITNPPRRMPGPVQAMPDCPIGPGCRSEHGDDAHGCVAHGMTQSEGCSLKIQCLGSATGPKRHKKFGPGRRTLPARASRRSTRGRCTILRRWLQVRAATLKCIVSG